MCYISIKYTTIIVLVVQFLNARKETQIGDLMTVMQGLEKKWIGGPRRALELWQLRLL